MEFDMSDSIGLFLFLSLSEMHYGINITKIVCNPLGSWNEKSDGISAVHYTIAAQRQLHYIHLYTVIYCVYQYL